MSSRRCERRREDTGRRRKGRTEGVAGHCRSPGQIARPAQGGNMARRQHAVTRDDPSTSETILPVPDDHGREATNEAIRVHVNEAMKPPAPGSPCAGRSPRPCAMTSRPPTMPRPIVSSTGHRPVPGPRSRLARWMEGSVLEGPTVLSLPPAPQGCTPPASRERRSHRAQRRVGNGQDLTAPGRPVTIMARERSAERLPPAPPEGPVDARARRPPADGRVLRLAPRPNLERTRGRHVKGRPRTGSSAGSAG